MGMTLLCDLYQLGFQGWVNSVKQDGKHTPPTHRLVVLDVAYKLPMAKKVRKNSPIRHSVSRAFSRVFG